MASRGGFTGPQMNPNVTHMNVGHTAGMRMPGMPQPLTGYTRSMNNAPQYPQVGFYNRPLCMKYIKLELRIVWSVCVLSLCCLGCLLEQIHTLSRISRKEKKTTLNKNKLCNCSNIILWTLLPPSKWLCYDFLPTVNWVQLCNKALVDVYLGVHFISLDI